MVTGVPDGLTARVPVPSDLDDVFELLAAQQQDLHDDVDITRPDLEAEWSRPSFDLATDAVLVADDTGPVGFVEVFGTVISGGVHPRAQHRGVGGWLLDWGIRHLREGGASTVGVSAPDLDDGLQSLLQARGFTRDYESWFFWQALGPGSDAPDAPPLRDVTIPDGLRVRNPDLSTDGRALYDVIETAFSEWPGRDPSTFEDWCAFNLEHDELEPATSWLVLDEDGTAIAAALSLTDRGWGWLSELAVRADRRGQGLGSLLLQQCLHSYRDLGLHTGGLATDSRTGARALYERNGFVVQRSFTRWTLPLS